MAREGFTGRFTFEAVLYRGKDAAPLTQAVNVNVRPNRPDPETTVTSATSATNLPKQPEPVATPKTAAATALSRMPETVADISAAEENALLANGWSLANNGNIASARLIFQDLSSKGSGVGAFALAQTYDPTFLKTIVFVGPQQASIEEAKKWYRLAAERGNRNAQERLKALEKDIGVLNR